jgi:CheY-like chemotaxis protein
MNLGEVVDALRPLLQRVLGESVALHCRLPATPVLAVADRAQVESALVNLALNARDAMPGGGTFTVAVDADTFAVATGAGAETTPRACARMRVSDTGIGMSAAVKERAFEPFFTTKEVGKGTGLGLSMVFGFAKQSGGHAELESAPRRGTTVTIMLPLAEAEASDEASPETPAVPEMPAAQEATAALEVPSAAGPATILVVEDDPLVRAQVALSIRSLGYQVIEVADGPAALQEIESERRIDLLFTDIVMPGGMNGRELAAKACATRAGLRVLFTSGYSDNVFIRDGRRETGPRLLGKPYRRPDLARMLREVLEEERPGVNGATKPIASTA